MAGERLWATGQPMTARRVRPKDRRRPGDRPRCAPRRPVAARRPAGTSRRARDRCGRGAAAARALPPPSTPRAPGFTEEPLRPPRPALAPLERPRHARIAADVVELAPRAERREDDVAVLEADPDAAHLRAAVL